MKNIYKEMPLIMADNFWLKENEVRYHNTLKLLNSSPRFNGNILDIGESNVFGEMFGAKHYVTCDLNWKWNTFPQKYSTITCFEVLEHVQNPLLLLREIYDHMEDDGTLFLTTPVRNFMTWISPNVHHFHEFSKAELEFCLSGVGFKIVTLKRIQGYTWRWKYIGVRSIIRLIYDKLFGQNFYLVAVK